MTRAILLLMFLFLASPASAEETVAPIGLKSLTAAPIGRNNNSDVFAALMEYQKMLSKESRASRQQAKEDARQAGAGRDRLLNLETVKIDDMRREAQDRYDRAMRAAQAEEQMGILIGNLGVLIGRLGQQPSQPAVQRPGISIQRNPCPPSNPGCLKTSGGLQPSTSHVTGSPTKPARKLGLQPAGSGKSIAAPAQTTTPAPSSDSSGTP